MEAFNTPPSASWGSHATCRTCWDAANPDRLPVRLKDFDETCCFCGARTPDGIFVREQADKVAFCKCEPGECELRDE